MTKISEKNGFTLIEILIAILILGTVLTTVYAAYTGTLRIVKDTGYEDDIYSMARVTMKRMTEDLESICKYDGSFKFISQKRDINNKEFTEISFLSSAHLNFTDGNSSGLAFINYFVEEDSEKEGYVLIRKDVLHKGEEDEEIERGGGFILCDKLQSLKYTFFDSKGEEHETWDSDSEAQKDKTPALISIHLNFTNPDDKENPYRFKTNVFIPMAKK
ncbi:MAG: prepilin-type N-terminal cleavage/methylation domain-containing protein [Proteobacteria bacterium]|nr:prepilin-type N-terminal cleavage/methylation domain-containing protein [Pseudomonadota bacterium]